MNDLVQARAIEEAPRLEKVLDEQHRFLYPETYTQKSS
jgi:hypothetical protein